MNPDAVAQYLQHNPTFFEDYADLMAQIFVPHPHGGRAISLPERQMMTLRDKAKSLEHTLGDLIRVGHTNDALSAKMHRLALALMRVPKDEPERIIETLKHHLREDFSIPHAAFRVWGVRNQFSALDDGSTVGNKLRDLTASATSPLKLPYCGPVAKFSYADGMHNDVPLGAPVTDWFGDTAPHIKSIAVMSLIAVHGSESSGDSSAGGILALASEDEARFYAGMGTLYLERLAELLSAALAHIFPAS